MKTINNKLILGSFYSMLLIFFISCGKNGGIKGINKTQTLNSINNSTFENKEKVLKVIEENETIDESAKNYSDLILADIINKKSLNDKETKNLKKIIDAEEFKIKTKADTFDGVRNYMNNQVMRYSDPYRNKLLVSGYLHGHNEQIEIFSNQIINLVTQFSFNTSSFYIASILQTLKMLNIGKITEGDLINYSYLKNITNAIGKKDNSTEEEKTDDKKNINFIKEFDVSDLDKYLHYLQKDNNLNKEITFVAPSYINTSLEMSFSKSIKALLNNFSYRYFYYLVSEAEKKSSSVLKEDIFLTLSSHLDYIGGGGKLLVMGDNDNICNIEVSKEDFKLWYENKLKYQKVPICTATSYNRKDDFHPRYEFPKNSKIEDFDNYLPRFDNVILGSNIEVDVAFKEITDFNDFTETKKIERGKRSREKVIKLLTPESITAHNKKVQNPKKKNRIPRKISINYINCPSYNVHKFEYHPGKKTPQYDDIDWDNLSVPEINKYWNYDYEKCKLIHSILTAYHNSIIANKEEALLFYTLQYATYDENLLNFNCLFKDKDVLTLLSDLKKVRLHVLDYSVSLNTDQTHSKIGRVRDVTNTQKKS